MNEDVQHIGPEEQKNMLHYIYSLDLAMFAKVNGWCGIWYSDKLVKFAETNNFLKGGVVMVAYWWFWFAQPLARQNDNRRTIVAALIGVVAALVIARGLADLLPFRMRPLYEAGIGYRAPSVQIPVISENWSSLPSDHAALFFALSFGIFCLSKPFGLMLMLYSAVWICLPRVYLGVHYPSDVFLGGAIGVASVWASIALLTGQKSRLGQRMMVPVIAFERKRPQVFYAAAFALTLEIAMIFDDVRDLVRGVLHVARDSGFLHLNESSALFVAGGIGIALGGIAWGALAAYRHGRRMVTSSDCKTSRHATGGGF